ncbi:MAG: hypothetical protein ACRERC_13970, partial [Candidatus Binatia bacterium]
MPDGFRTFTRTALLLAGIVALALVLATLVARLPPVRRWAATQVAAQLGPQVGIGAAALTLLPPGVRLDDVTFTGSEGQPTQRVRSLRCQLRLGALLGGHIEVAAIALDGAALTIERQT